MNEFIKQAIIGTSIIVAAWIMRPPAKTDQLNKYLLKQNKDLRDTILERERQISKIKLDILKSHENEKEIINTLPNAPVERLDSIWQRFFDKYSD